MAIPILVKKLANTKKIPNYENSRNSTELHG